MSSPAADPRAQARPVTPAGLLAARLEDALARVEALGESVDPELAAAVRAAHGLATGLEPYTARATTPASDALRALADRTAAEDWDAAHGDGPALEQEMLSGHVEGQFLKTLVRATRARRVLDIGMFTGYSALAMAEGLPDDGEVVACEIDSRAAAIAREAFEGSPAGARIDIALGPAAQTLEALTAEQQQFDFVFIDADKAGYGTYLDLVLDSVLLAPGGLVCIDNTLMQGLPWGAGEPSSNGDAIAHFNDALTADPRVEQVLVPLRDGITLVQRV